MMVIVPAFAHGEDSENEVVAAFITRFVGFASPEMANGIDAPGHVMDQEDPNQAAPDKAEQGTGPITDEQPTEACWNEKADQNPHRKQRADRANAATFEQVGNVLLQRQLMMREQPTDMRVENPLKQPLPTLPVQVR